MTQAVVEALASATGSTPPETGEEVATRTASTSPHLVLIEAAPRHNRGQPPASYFARALTVTGRLDTTGEIHIDGRFRGPITAERLVVGRDGYVEGDVVANAAHIGGRVRGRIYVRNVTLANTADVTGRIFHNTATVEKGARIDGRMPWRPLAYFERLEHLREAQ